MTNAMWTRTEIETAVRWAYARTLDGTGGLETAAVIAESHHRPVQTSLQLADEIVGWQLARMTIPHFFEQLKPALAVPDALPEVLATTLYLELRIAAAIAYGAGRDLRDARVRALVMSCLLLSEQGAVLSANGLDSALLVNRAVMKDLPATIVEPLEQATIAWLETALAPSGALAATWTSVEAPWATTDRAKAIGATARDRFMVLRHW